MALTGHSPCGVLAVLQARMSSTRLPGKVLAPLLGRPMLARQIERLMHARRIDELVIATSHRSDDDAVAELAVELGLVCVRGASDDVLDRYWQAAVLRWPAHVVRVTGDCPLTDPGVVDLVIERHLADGNDYTSNTLDPTWPDGLDVEILTLNALRICWTEARGAAEREHVTLFIKRHPERFVLGNVRAEHDTSASRWTVDEHEDLEFVRAIYEELYSEHATFSSRDVHELLDRCPQLATLNAHLERDAGLKRSIEEERELQP